MNLVYLIIGVFSLYAMYTYLRIGEKEVDNRIIYGLILISSIVMFLVGEYHNRGVVDFELLFSSIKPALDLITFKVDFDSIRVLYESNVFFKYSFLLLILATWISVIHVIVTVFFSSFYNRLQIRKNMNKDHYIVMGENNFSKEFIKQSSKPVIYWLLESDEEKIVEIRNIKQNFLIFTHSKEFINKYVNQKSTIIIFGDSMEYLEVVQSIEKKSSFDISLYLNQSNFEYTDLFRRMINNMNMNIHLFNLHELTVQSFMQEHPISMNLPESVLDRAIGLVQEDAKIQMMYIGYGETNQMMHYHSLMNDIFITSENGVLSERRIEYYIFDKVTRINPLTRNIYEYNEERYSNQDYFDVYPSLSKPTYIETNVYKADFLVDLREFMVGYSFTEIVVDLGDDLVNIETAFKIAQFTHQENAKIYSRVQSKDLIKRESLSKDITENGITLFGNLEDIVNEKVIVNQNLDTLGKKQAYRYQFGLVEPNAASLEAHWNTLSNEKRLSNRLSSASTIFKLGLFGVRLEDMKAVQKFKFLYDGEFKNLNVKNILAAQEKFRWNAYYLSLGYRPLAKSQIKYNENDDVYIHQDPIKKRHACITSLKGLNEFDEYISNDYLTRKDISFSAAYEKLNVKKYDYMVVDNLFAALEADEL